MMPGGLDPISELQRLTVSLRGGFEQKDGCLVFHFTGQLDAYSEKQFMEYVGDVLKANKLPSVLDLSKIDFLDQITEMCDQDLLFQLPAESFCIRKCFQIVEFIFV